MTAPATLPPVSGRHRNRVLASARKTRAIELKLQGLTYQQVADEMGYANRGFRPSRDNASIEPNHAS